MFRSPCAFLSLCLVVSSWYYFILQVESAPQRDVNDLNKELQQRGLKPLCSGNDFKTSFTCTSCGTSLHYQDNAKAMWLIKRHANENSHKIKAGWYLDANSHVLASKPKDKRQ